MSIRKFAQWVCLGFGSIISGAGGVTGVQSIYDVPNEVVAIAEVQPEVAMKQLELSQKQSERMIFIGGGLMAAAGGLSLKKDEDGE